MFTDMYSKAVKLSRRLYYACQSQRKKSLDTAFIKHTFSKAKKKLKRIPKLIVFIIFGRKMFIT